MYVMRRGMVVRLWRFLNRGDVFGEDMLIGNSELQDHAQAVCMSFVETFVLSKTDLTSLLREHPYASAPIQKKIRMMIVTRSLLYELSFAQTGRPPRSWVPRSLASGYSISNEAPDLDQKIDHLTAKVEAATAVAEGKEPPSTWLSRFERRLASGEDLNMLHSPLRLGSNHPTGPPSPLRPRVERPPAWLGGKQAVAQDPLAEPGHLHVVVERARANMPLGLALIPSGTGHLIVNDVANGGLIRSSGANIIKGDQLVGVNGTRVESLDGFVELLHGLPLGELVFEVLRPVEEPGTAHEEVVPSAEADAISGAVSGAVSGVTLDSRQREQREQREEEQRHHHHQQQQQEEEQQQEEQQQQQELKTTLQAMLKMQQGLQKQQRALFLSMQAQSQATLELSASQRKIQEELALLADVLIVASEVRKATVGAVAGAGSEVRKATAGAVTGAGPPPEQLTQWRLERRYDAARSQLASHLDEQRQIV